MFPSQFKCFQVNKISKLTVTAKIEVVIFKKL